MPLTPPHSYHVAAIIVPVARLLDPGYQIDRHYDELKGAPGSKISEVETVGSGHRVRYQNGAIYVSTDTPAAWVYGAIGDHYTQLGSASGFLGFPKTDETGCPDGRGRYNHFQHGSIYWTAHTGAFEVHGAIRDKWKDLGWEAGFLGYPLSDETGIPGSQGRKNVFEGGAIVFSLTAGAFESHDKDLPPSIASGPVDIRFSGGTPVGRNAQLVVNKDGSAIFSGHLHDSRAPDYTDSVAATLICASNKTAYLVVHNGEMHGILPGSRNDDWTDSSTIPGVSDAWVDIIAGHSFQITTKVDWDPAGWVEAIKEAYPYIQAVVQAIAAAV